MLTELADVLGFIMTITFMFALGDIDADLSDPSGQPWVAVIYRITGSQAATIVLILIMVSPDETDIHCPPRVEQFAAGKICVRPRWNIQANLSVGQMFMYFFCAVNQVTTSSRQVFAFARDKVSTD